MKAEIRQAMLTLLEKRGPGKTICPSEVARKIAPNFWRTYMPDVREIALELVQEGKVLIMQKGVPVDPDDFNGPIRIRLV